MDRVNIEIMKKNIQFSIIKALLSFIRKLESMIGDLLMNVNTSGSVYFYNERGVNNDAFDFETNAHSTIRKAIRLITLKKNDTVIVLGCGKGRTVCHFARQKVRKVIGIELDKTLSEIAEKNSKKLWGRRADIQIINGDAASVNMSDGTVFYLFNPFGKETLSAVLNNIKKTHYDISAPVIIVYVNPQFSDVFEEYSWLEISFEYKRVSGLKVIIYKSKI